METAILRGPRPAPGFAGLRAALKEHDAAIRPWLEGLEAAAAPFAALMALPEVDARELLQAHVEFAEWLAATDDEAGAARLWSAEAGAQAARFVAGLLEAAPALPPMAPAHYPALLDALMEDHVVRPPYGRHPRLQIWGPLEARLQHADCMILGGLNEGVWPPAAAGDPWMSRPMRADFGLPPPELRIGLSAHDFVQCCGAAGGLSHAGAARRRHADHPGALAPASRCLAAERLRGCGGAAHHGARAARLVGGPGPAGRVFRPPARARPGTAGCQARPRQLSVTKIETWIADPYSIYARDILRLKVLDPVDADPSAAERGIIIHRILDAFVREHPDALPPDAEARLLALGRAHFEAAGARPGVLAFWWPRFERIAQWFLDTERARRPALQPLATEVNGVLDLEGPAGPFRLTAKADRIDRTEAGALEIIDYKTGGIPPKKHVTEGRCPQLSLEAAIAQAGGFAGVDAAEVAALAYWRLSGAETAGEIIQIGGDAGEACGRSSGRPACADRPLRRSGDPLLPRAPPGARPTLERLRPPRPAQGVVGTGRRRVMAAHAPGMTPAQHRASDPAASVWVGASAGTGKTKVLTDRVLRLLLGGTAPERILCLTFTRAAAAEMALRISSELARWTVADDETLSAALTVLTGAPPRRTTLDRARRLFAAVLDVPDGLKIQTIHAFCQSLLRRFPLEAGVAPNFEIADERMSTTLVGRGPCAPAACRPALRWTTPLRPISPP